VTILDDSLFKTFIDYFMKVSGRNLPEIRLGDAHFCVTEILTTPGSHPWAGYTSVEDLEKKLDEPAPEKLKFELFTVTSFKLQDKSIEQMPKPKHVFGNLAGAWRQLTGQNHVQVIEEYVEKHLVMGNHHLQRRKTMLHNTLQLGAVGQVEFIRTDEEDSPAARALNLLADLAFYTGLGRKTAQGMGMVSRIIG
jgi:CRISPR-associated endoribonuclease Cas6